MPKQTFSCQECSRIFKNRGTLNNHLSRARRGLVAVAIVPPLCKSCSNKMFVMLVKSNSKPLRVFVFIVLLLRMADFKVVMVKQLSARSNRIANQLLSGSGKSCWTCFHLWKTRVFGIHSTMMVQVHVECAKPGWSVSTIRRWIFLPFPTSGKLTSSSLTHLFPSSPGSSNICSL